MTDRDVHLEAFLDQFQGEIDALWAEIATRKRALWEQYGPLISAEESFAAFRTEYGAYFNVLENRRARLLERKQRLQRAYAALDEAADPHRPDLVPLAKATLPEAPDLGMSGGEIGGVGDWSGFRLPDDPPPDSPPLPPPPGEDERPQKLAKVVIETFQWMYHDKPGLKDQNQLLNDLKRKKATSAEVLMRMPFTDADAALWAAPRSGRTEADALYERYFRFRLWVSLLPAAESRAREIAQQIQRDELFPEFQKWQATRKTLQLYLHSIEKDRRDLIEALEAEISALEEGLGGGST